MSTDFSIRPVGAPAPTPVVQPVSQAASNAVSTDLPASQSVTATDASVAVRNDVGNSSDSDFISHQAYIDQAAASIVYQVVDDRTNTVVRQYPDEAALRRRAYFHTLDMAKGAPTPQLATDRKA
jgi:hypothetical protein